MYRLNILCLAVLALALALAGCACGGSPFGTQTEVAKPAAQAVSVTHTGCTLTGGMQCGTESIAGFRLDVPDIRPLFRSVWGIVNPGTPSPVKAEADPCGEPAKGGE